jgi:HK97 family phage major capsid protein
MENDIAAQVAEKLSSLDTFMGDIRKENATYADRLDKMREAITRMAGMPHGRGVPMIPETVGALVAKSELVAEFMRGSLRGSARVSVPGRVCKTVITTGADLKPGIQTTPVEPLPREPLGVLDLITQVPLTQGVLQVVRQKNRATPGAAVQLHEGDVKAEQDLQFTTGQLVPETLAAWIPVSRQAAMDVAGLQALINTELLYLVKVLEENQVLNGTGTLALPVEGQFTGLNVNAPVIATTSTTALDAIADLLGALLAAGVRPSGVVLNPVDALALAKLKTINGEYLLGSPAAQPGSVLWGVSFAVSTRQPAGTVLAGDFSRGARLWFREDATIEISSEHADFFVRNLLAVRCEERAVLELVQPAYFGKVTLPAGTVQSNGQKK